MTIGWVNILSDEQFVHKKKKSHGFDARILLLQSQADLVYGHTLPEFRPYYHIIELIRCFDTSLFVKATSSVELIR